MFGFSTQLIAKKFEKAFEKVSGYVETAKSRGDQLSWKNYIILYKTHVRHAKIAFKALRRSLKKSEFLNDYLQKMEDLLGVVFEVETPTNKKYEALQNFRPMWRDFLSELEQLIRSEYDIFPKRGYEVDERLCFVVMPFDKTYRSIYDKAIKPTVRRAGLRCKRADDIFGVSPIVSDIWRHINKARLIIADLTNRNPNVFYEVGLSHALGKRVILLAQKSEDVPFDVKHIRCIPYNNTEGGRRKLSRDLFRTIKSLLK